VADPEWKRRFAAMTRQADFAYRLEEQWIPELKEKYNCLARTMSE